MLIKCLLLHKRCYDAVHDGKHPWLWCSAWWEASVIMMQCMMGCIRDCVLRLQEAKLREAAGLWCGWRKQTDAGAHGRNRTDGINQTSHSAVRSHACIGVRLLSLWCCCCCVFAVAVVQPLGAVGSAGAGDAHRRSGEALLSEHTHSQELALSLFSWVRFPPAAEYNPRLCTHSEEAWGVLSNGTALFMNVFRCYEGFACKQIKPLCDDTHS